jgi:nucleoid DNA-binding protein
MNKTQLIAAVAGDLELPKTQGAIVVQAVLDNIMDGTVVDGECALSDFGIFKVKHRDARKGHNPQDGSPLDIAAKDIVGFKAYKGFKEAL